MWRSLQGDIPAHFSKELLLLHWICDVLKLAHHMEPGNSTLSAKFLEVRRESHSRERQREQEEEEEDDDEEEDEGGEEE